MRRRVTPKFWLFMIVTMLMVFGVSFIVTQHQYAQGTRQLAEVEDSRNTLAERVEALSDELAYAQTDDFIMRAARDELGMIMPGEVRYVNSSK